MLRAKLFYVLVFSILLASGSVVLWAAMKDSGEEKVELSDVPEKVIEAANEAVSGGKITEAEREMEDDVLIYDLVKVVDGVEYEIEVTASGIVLEIEKAGDEEDDYANMDDDADDDAEEEVVLSDAPDVVIKVARAAIPAGKIVEVEKETEDGETVYEVEMMVKYEIKITADGVLRKIEEETDDDEGEDEEGDVEGEKDDDD